MTDMTHTLVRIAELTAHKGMAYVAAQVFPDNEHMQEKGRHYNNDFAGFMLYLDTSHRKQVANWIEDNWL